jgi:hypothetical protein
MRKFFLNAVVVLSLTAVLSACSEGGDKDPYARVTLHQATHGMVVSKQFKYKFSNPEIVALHRHLGLIREGNQLEFIAARSLEDKLEGVLGSDFIEFAVVKRYSPYVYFKVDRVVAGTDTIFPAQAGGIELPNMTTAELYGIDNFEERDINTIAWNNTSALNRLKDEKIKVSARVVEETIEGNPQFWLIGERAKLRVGSVNDATALFLKVLARNNYTFEGGIRLTEVENFGDRRQNHVAGTVAVDYLMYGDRLITGS